MRRMASRAVFAGLSLGYADKAANVSWHTVIGLYYSGMTKDHTLRYNELTYLWLRPPLKLSWRTLFVARSWGSRTYLQTKPLACT